MIKVRQYFYLFCLAYAAISAALLFFHIVDKSTLDAWEGVLVSIGGVLGVAVPGVAGYNLNKQDKSGALAPAPPVADQAIANIEATFKEAADRQGDAQRVVEALGKAGGTVQSIVDLVVGAATPSTK